MDSDGHAGLLFIIIAAAVKAFLTVCETAVTEVDDRKLKKADGKKGRKTLQKLLEKPARLVTAFAVGRTLTTVIIAYAAVFYCLAPLTGALEKAFGGDPDPGERVWYSFAAAVIILLCTVLLLTVFCDGIPKRLASGESEKGSEKLACFCAPVVKYLVIILTPLTFLTALLVKLFSPGASSEKDVVTEEEILMMVDAGNETGVIEESQREMINNIFDFDDVTVSDVMTHRTEVTAVKVGSEVSKVVNAAIESGFSRIPVYEDTIDHIIGIICVKDLLCLVGSEAAADAEVKSFVRDILYLPESVTCGEAFKRLTDNKMQMAAVIDEYGGTAGIVTMEDIIETIVGSIQDEYDEEEEELIKISDDTYTIAGTADPGRILPQFGIELPEDNGFDTMSGFVVELLGRIPEENENPSAGYENMLFTVLVTEDKFITKIKAQIISENIIEKENKGNEEKD
ncbi:MAG: HlyC/CorC family transporter [Oscillospiraceae bacterium]|nr:HlyC/CorC family transporter [Oscillospiraceae bacterium]